MAANILSLALVSIPVLAAATDITEKELTKREVFASGSMQLGVSDFDVTHDGGVFRLEVSSFHFHGELKRKLDPVPEPTEATPPLEVNTEEPPLDPPFMELDLDGIPEMSRIGPRRSYIKEPDRIRLQPRPQPDPFPQEPQMQPQQPQPKPPPQPEPTKPQPQPEPDIGPLPTLSP